MTSISGHLSLGSKVNGANMGPTWVLSAPDGPHVGPMNLAIQEGSLVVEYIPRIMYMVLCSLQWHHNGTMASQITSLMIVYSAVYSDTDERKHQSSVSLAFVRGINRWPVNWHKGPVTRKMFPFGDVIRVVLCCGMTLFKLTKFTIPKCTI